MNLLQSVVMGYFSAKINFALKECTVKHILVGKFYNLHTRVRKHKGLCDILVPRGPRGR